MDAFELDLGKNPAAKNLQVLDRLVRNHSIRAVRLWKERGIGTVDPAVIEAFRQLGYPYRARSGTEYEHTKDIMHLELLAPVALSKAAGRERPLDLSDLQRGQPVPAAPVRRRQPHVRH